MSFGILLNENNNVNGTFEVDILLMSSDGPNLRYVLRLSNGNLKSYIDLEKFPFDTKLFASFLIRSNSMFILKAVYENESKFYGLPQSFLVYPKRPGGECYTTLFIDCEKALCDFLKHNLGKLYIPTKKTVFKSVYSIGHPRNLDVEQRQVAQNLLNCTLTKSEKIEIKNELFLNEMYSLNLSSWRIVRNDAFVETTHLLNNMGFIHCASSSGRRRTIGCFLDCLRLAQEVKSDDMLAFGAIRTSLVFTKNLEKWKKEIPDAICLHNSEDLNNINYEQLKSGTTILCDNWIFDELDAHELKDLYSIQMACSREGNSNNKSFLRIHTNYLSEFYPKTIVPLTLIKFGAIVIDDVDAVSTYHNVKFYLKYFKLWITIRSENSALKFTTLPVLNKFIDYECCFIRALEQKQANPLYWSQVIKNDHFINVPKSILKKVTLVDCAVKLPVEESSVFLKFCDIRSNVSGLPRKVEISSKALLNYPIDDIDGCLLSVLLQRLCPITKEIALQNINQHFAKNLKGTIAQRISKSESDSLNLPQASENGSFADAAFVQSNFDNLDQCQICYSEQANQVTLCGHGFCKDCADMLKKDKLLCLCPVCRSSLCDYDWIQLSSESTVKEYKITKILKLEDTLKKLVAKRSKKKIHENIFVATNLTENIQYLKDDNIFVVTFEELKSANLGNFATIIFASPPPTDDINYALIKRANQEDISIQIHFIYAENYEEVQALHTKELFLSEVRKKPKVI